MSLFTLVLDCFFKGVKAIKGRRHVLTSYVFSAILLAMSYISVFWIHTFQFLARLPFSYRSSRRLWWYLFFPTELLMLCNIKCESHRPGRCSKANWTLLPIVIQRMRSGTVRTSHSSSTTKYKMEIKIFLSYNAHLFSHLLLLRPQILHLFLLDMFKSF